MERKEEVFGLSPKITKNYPVHKWMESMVLTHNHALFKVDNGAVYDMIESLTQGSDVTSSIAPFCKTRDGRGALNALKSQHAGKAVYDCLVKEAEQTLSNKVWNGNTSTSLTNHMGAQRKAWISMQEYADHALVDVPNEQARVTYLMDLPCCCQSS
jgi:muconolactone delta-isomerase